MTFFGDVRFGETLVRGEADLGLGDTFFAVAVAPLARARCVANILLAALMAL